MPRMHKKFPGQHCIKDQHCVEQLNWVTKSYKFEEGINDNELL